MSWKKRSGNERHSLAQYGDDFEVQEYLEVKEQRNKSSSGNTHLVKVNNGYHQEWALRDLR